MQSPWGQQHKMEKLWLLLTVNWLHLTFPAQRGGATSVCKMHFLVPDASALCGNIWQSHSSSLDFLGCQLKLSSGLLLTLNRFKQGWLSWFFNWVYTLQWHCILFFQQHTFPVKTVRDLKCRKTLQHVSQRYWRENDNLRCQTDKWQITEKKPHCFLHIWRQMRILWLWLCEAADLWDGCFASRDVDFLQMFFCGDDMLKMSQPLLLLAFADWSISIWSVWHRQWIIQEGKEL